MISGYTTLLDPEAVQLPWRESISSMLGFCDEVVVLDGGSTDGSYPRLLEWSRQERRLRVAQSPYDASVPLMDGLSKQHARSLCRGTVVFQMDADEVIHEADFPRLRSFLLEVEPDWPIFSLPVINLMGSESRADLLPNPWKWRFSFNHRDIGHGVEIHNRLVNARGQSYSATTDGCEWINLNDGNWQPVGGFVRHATPWDADGMARDVHEAAKHMPVIWHYSCLSLERKARMWHRFWRRQWETLRQGPTLENAQWSRLLPTDPTDEDFKRAAALALAEARTYGVRLPPPPSMRSWVERHT